MVQSSYDDGVFVFTWSAFSTNVMICLLKQNESKQNEANKRKQNRSKRNHNGPFYFFFFVACVLFAWPFPPPSAPLGTNARSVSVRLGTDAVTDTDDGNEDGRCGERRQDAKPPAPSGGAHETTDAATADSQRARGRRLGRARWGGGGWRRGKRADYGNAGATVSRWV